MVSYSQIEYEVLKQQRRDSNARRHILPAKLGVREENESALHDKITEYCKAKVWAVIHARMDKRSGVTLGAPDFVIYADAGRVINIECKTKDGKQRQSQRNFEAMLKRNGHEYHIVRSFEDFLKIV